ncbi:MAG: hypothetical protein HY929_01530 [Euryarchaeota archaeon]|nr:hypothetical protein [Euryarchaeota archaeon]
MAEEIPRCSNCKRTDNEVKLIQYYFKGKKDFVCVQCLPFFIHG